MTTPPTDEALEAELRDRLARLDVAAKVRLMTGANFWAMYDEPTVGLRELVVADGPSGVRGFTWDERDPSASLPSASAVAATWDEDLLARVAGVLASEARRTSEVESEGFDRDTLALPGEQDALVRAVAATGTPTVVVVNSGAPVLLPWRSDVDAVLLSWFGGQEYGRALAEVLLGDREPGGRLPTTWPDREEDVPVLDTSPAAGVLSYDEGIHIGYRAWERTGATPAYPFGAGQGYTTWDLDALTVVDDVGVGALRATVRVTNTGERAGKQVVQAYLSRPDSQVERPTVWLAGFAVVRAQAGESTLAQLVLDRRAFEHWSPDAGAWQLEPGAFELSVGSSVADRPLTTEVAV